jgi:hypothetical protein
MAIYRAVFSAGRSAIRSYKGHHQAKREVQGLRPARHPLSVGHSAPGARRSHQRRPGLDLARRCSARCAPRGLARWRRPAVRTLLRRSFFDRAMTATAAAGASLYASAFAASWAGRQTGRRVGIVGSSQLYAQSRPKRSSLSTKMDVPELRVHWRRHGQARQLRLPSTVPRLTPKRRATVRIPTPQTRETTAAQGFLASRATGS